MPILRCLHDWNLKQRCCSAHFGLIQCLVIYHQNQSSCRCRRTLRLKCRTVQYRLRFSLDVLFHSHMHGWWVSCTLIVGWLIVPLCLVKRKIKPNVCKYSAFIQRTNDQEEKAINFSLVFFCPGLLPHRVIFRFIHYVFVKRWVCQLNVSGTNARTRWEMHIRTRKSVINGRTKNYQNRPRREARLAHHTSQRWWLDAPLWSHKVINVNSNGYANRVKRGTSGTNAVCLYSSAWLMHRKIADSLLYTIWSFGKEVIQYKCLRKSACVCGHCITTIVSVYVCSALPVPSPLSTELVPSRFSTDFWLLLRFDACRWTARKNAI